MAPNDPSTWYNLGNLERRAGVPDSAIAHYRRAQRGDSLFRPAWQMEVQTLVENRRQPEAAETYRRWLAELPEDHGARMSAIKLETDLDRPEAAMEIARQGVEDNPGDAHAVEILGTTLAAQGRWREGLKSMREAERLYQGDPTAMPALDAVVAHMRRVAPDSLRSLFATDSVETAARRAAAAEARKHPKPKYDDVFK
jgi:tetratricopeptide (TPR) repeat protein